MPIAESSVLAVVEMDGVEELPGFSTFSSDATDKEDEEEGGGGKVREGRSDSDEETGLVDAEVEELDGVEVEEEEGIICAGEEVLVVAGNEAGVVVVVEEEGSIESRAAQTESAKKGLVNTQAMLSAG